MNSVLLFLLFAATTVRRPVGFSFLFVFAWCLSLEKTKTKKKEKKKNRMLVLSNICDEYCRKAEKKLARKLILQLKRKDYNLGFHHIRCLNFPVLSL